MLHPKRRIRPAPLVKGSAEVVDLIDNYYNAYNSARLREACQTFARMIDDGTTIGVSIAGALTPAGLSSVLVPLMQAGFIDYLSSTGANLYHDLHFDLDLALYRGQPDVVSGAQDVALRKDGIIRVYDVLFPADVLYKTDEWLYRVMMAPEFGKRMSGSELHHLIGKYVMEMSAVVLDAKRKAAGLSGVVIFGGGAPKNFLLQTEPQLQEILGVAEKGHDYFIQITDARPDTGGISGATPAEAVSWGKIDPEKLPDCVVCYVDSTIAVPLLGAYLSARCPPREPKHLYRRLPEMVAALRDEYKQTDLYKRYWGK